MKNRQKKLRKRKRQFRHRDSFFQQRKTFPFQVVCRKRERLLFQTSRVYSASSLKPLINEEQTKEIEKEETPILTSGFIFLTAQNVPFSSSLSKTRTRAVPDKPSAFTVSLHFYMLDNART